MPYIRFIRVTTFETDNFSQLCDMRNYRKQREEYRKMGKGYYHLVTDGWKDGCIFNNIAQFTYGMMLIGLITLRYSIVIYDFTLMPNHIHIILSGTGNDAVEAFLYLKRKLNLRLVADHYNPLPEDYGFKLIPIEDKAQMKELIIYLDRNHYEKEFAVPGGYPWGSGYLHYSLFADLLHGKRVSELRSKELEALTGCRIELPAHWEIHPVLGLLPKSFVNTRLVRQLVTEKGQLCGCKLPFLLIYDASTLQYGHVAWIVDVLALHGVEVIQQAGVMLLNLAADYLHG